MQFSFREGMTELHGLGFAALFLLAFSGAFVELSRIGSSDRAAPLSARELRFINVYLSAMVVLAWAAVLSGAYIVYPWYRAHPPAGVTDLTEYPQRLLLSRSTTAGWHNLGMEWKEHVAWFAPIAITMVAYVFKHYGADFARHSALRSVVLGFAAAAFAAAGIAGIFGALINKHAPIEGGATINLVSAAK